jgi:hypothetical protein
MDGYPPARFLRIARSDPGIFFICPSVADLEHGVSLWVLPEARAILSRNRALGEALLRSVGMAPVHPLPVMMFLLHRRGWKPEQQHAGKRLTSTFLLPEAPSPAYVASVERLEPYAPGSEEEETETETETETEAEETHDAVLCLVSEADRAGACLGTFEEMLWADLIGPHLERPEKVEPTLV